MKITRIHQIELTSRCNLTCKYCVHPNMKRTKEDMTWSLLTKAVETAKYCVDHYGQQEINLAGIGESTMHPDFIEMLYYVRDELGDKVKIVLATNGVSLTEAMAKALGNVGAWVWVSAHRPEKAGPAVELLKKYGVLKGISADPTVAAIDWAGQVKWHTSTNVNEQCPWLTYGTVMVASDGKLLTCCLDGDGIGVVGTVYDDFKQLEVASYELCSKCHLKVPSGMSNPFNPNELQKSVDNLKRRKVKHNTPYTNANWPGPNVDSGSLERPRYDPDDLIGKFNPNNPHDLG